MPRFSVKREQVVELFLVEQGGGILLKATLNGFVAYILTIEQDGKIYLTRDVPKSLGFSLDENGRVKIGSS